MKSTKILEELKIAALNGMNVFTALRQSMGYSLEDLAIASGLTIEEITLIENNQITEPKKIDRLTSSVGLPLIKIRSAGVIAV